MKSIFIITITIIIIMNVKNEMMEPTSYCGRFDGVAFSLPSKDFMERHTLRQVQHIFRHGDRVPMAGLPLYNEEEPWVEWKCANRRIVQFEQSSMKSTPFVLIPTTDSMNNNGTVLRGDCFVAQLTGKGSAQHRTLWKSLKEHYVDRLNF